MTNAAKKRRRDRDLYKLNFRLKPEVWAQLNQQAEKEDRTMAYLARVFIQQGLSDRNRGGGIRTNGN